VGALVAAGASVGALVASTAGASVAVATLPPHADKIKVSAMSIPVKEYSKGFLGFILLSSFLKVVRIFLQTNGIAQNFN
jgi:hypothetical protein